MTVFSKILLFSAIICSLTSSAFERGRKIDVNGREITIGNDRLSLTMLPERSGRITSLYLTGKKLELLTPGKVTAVEETPLFSYTTDNMMGIYELIWGAKINGTVGMKCTAAANKAVFDGKFYGNIEIDLFREVTIVPDAFELQFKTTITNKAKTPQKIAPWLHLVGNPRSFPQIPQAAGTQRREGFGNIGKNAVPQLFTFGKHNNYLLPGANWIGIVLHGKSVAWALRLPQGTLDKEGVFYSWGDGKVGGIQTSEVVWPKYPLKPQEKFTFTYSIEIFPGLNGLNAIIGHTGMALEVKNGKLMLKFAASAKEAARKAVLECKSKEGKVTTFDLAIPALDAGKCIEIPVNADALPRSAVIRTGGKTYTVFM